jgi:hypothetical protein
VLQVFLIFHQVVSILGFFDMTIRLLAIIAILANLITPSFAADNAVIMTAGSGITFRSKDIGAGVQSPMHIIGDLTGTAIYGTAGTANANVITIQGIASGTVVPVSLTSTTITGTVAATQSGTWNITNVSGTVSLPTGAATAANQATEISSLATIATNTGAAIPAGSAIIGQVGIDQTTAGTTNAISLKYLNTTAIDTNSGNKSAGTQRNVLATDQLALATWGQGATGAAPPSGMVQIGANASGATGGLMAGLVQCDNKAVYDASTNGSTELQALTSGRTIYVCGYTILAAGTANVKLIYGTGTACATGSANLTPAYQLTTQVGIVDSSPFYRGMKTASANALCINTSAGVAVQAIVYYAII